MVTCGPAVSPTASQERLSATKQVLNRPCSRVTKVDPRAERAFAADGIGSNRPSRVPRTYPVLRKRLIRSL
jgi:hypothetical protein